MNLYLRSVCVCECVVLARCFAVSRHLAVHMDDLQTAYLWLADRLSLWDSPTIAEKGFLFSSACITLFHTPLTPFSNPLLKSTTGQHTMDMFIVLRLDLCTTKQRLTQILLSSCHPHNTLVIPALWL